MWRSRLLRTALDDAEETSACMLLVSAQPSKRQRHGGSRPDRSPNRARDFQDGPKLLVQLSFAEP
ncbi:TPA: hypothetical protein N0F65_006156 [Lagenidium giganteum]|uniref:Uncharacterized protein n=1 Tax=Lagenidium giganteum TaxID=4803 RepID=A0AAV2Z7K5_9STRA|nr:TPA: hypothetical protein N0F65_006156 [Lagenidium giganteum]